MRRVIGLDLGDKTLGIAASDLSQTIANVHSTIRFEQDDFDTAILELKKVVGELNPEKIILGLPKNMDGSIGFQARKALDFKTRLESEFNLEVVMIDERLTSKMAESIMLEADLSRKKRKTKVDKLAATLILQSYLDRRP
ncbi:MAG: Holliday junction resolvase RuvX [Bacilli bacterium]|nr:Holliday junction resolvase RuvX [Bacilli bacterium]MBN2877067.1 Holliday junction resolvase RuvX [Bacilli bacterium]